MKKINTSLLSHKSLLAFHVTAKEKSFTKAARQLNVGQPAVSHAVRQLEDMLDTVLFERVYRGVTLTPDGKLLAKHLNKGFAEIERGLAAIRDKNQQQITIYVSTSLASHWLMPRIARFTRQHPDIQLRCMTQDTDEAVQKGNFDLCVPLGQVPWDDFQRVKLVDEVILPVCSKSYLEESQALTNIEDLTNHALIHQEERMKPRLEWRQFFEDSNLSYRNSTADQTFSDYSIVLQAAVEGQGVALGWKHLVTSLIEEGKLVAPLDVEIKTEHPFYILIPKDKANNESILLLRDWLLDEMVNTFKTG